MGYKYSAEGIPVVASISRILINELFLASVVFVAASGLCTKAHNLLVAAS